MLPTPSPAQAVSPVPSTPAVRPPPVAVRSPPPYAAGPSLVGRPPPAGIGTAGPAVAGADIPPALAIPTVIVPAPTTPAVDVREPPQRLIRIPELPWYVAPALVATLAGLIVLLLVLLARSRRQRWRAGELERGKLAFLLLASHEFRTPVSVLAGYLSMALDGSLGEMPAQAREALPEMEGKVREIQSKLDRMLLAVSASYGRLSLSPEPVAASELIGAAVDRTHLSGHARARFLSAGSVDALVLCDREYTVLALALLIENAAKFSGASTPVVCTVERSGRSGEVLIRVVDRGQGVPKEVQKVLFKRFGRQPGPRDSHLAGAGLGLYLAREVARAQGGDVSLVTSQRAGSEFLMRLPAPDGRDRLAEARP